jgi:PAS domain S-box-containing protein
LKAIAEVHGMAQASQGSPSAAGKSARDYAVLRSVTRRRLGPSIAIAKRIENSLRESEARLLLATASAKLGVYERDVQADRTVWLNDRMYEIFGRSRRDGPLTRQHFIDHYLHPDDVPAFEAGRKRALEGNGCFVVECRIRLANGEQRWIQINGTFLFTDHGEPSRLLGVVCDITERKHLEQRARELSDRLVSIQEDERQRIAQELHDSTAQHLAGVSLQLFALRPPHLTGRVRRCWDEVEVGLNQAMSELRTFSHLMHPPGLQTDGLCAAIRHYVSGYRERSGLEISVLLHTVLDQLPYDMQCTLLRIVQEALGNIQRHASASRAAIGLRPFRDTVHLVVSDNGWGIVPSFRPGRGILGMQARAARFNGDLRIRSGQHGTRVHAWIKATGYERASEHNTPSLEQTRQRAKIAAEKSRVTAESVKSTISDMRDWLQMRTGGNRVNSSEF